MKLSLAWIFDHLDADWRRQDVDYIYRQFNRITAEMEGLHYVKHDLTQFFFGMIESISGNQATVHIPELKQTITMPARALAMPGALLLKKSDSTITWATFADFANDKEGALPAFDVSPALLNGAWREHWQATDVLIEVDNKSITHRPDMWGHRGFAREFSAFLNIPLKPVTDFLTTLPVNISPQASTKTATMPIGIANQAPQVCTRFTALFLDQVENKPCNLLIASRLLNIGARPIDGIVDVTNYLMNDWGQPVHAYDADSIADGQLIVRMAREGESISLLGGFDVTLTANDTVVADTAKALCLAGVKGGANSGVSAGTKQVLLEAATWDAGTIRRTAQRHKMRTDSSARIEKTLDPEQTTQACQRFISLLNQAGIVHKTAPVITLIGAVVPPQMITIEHQFLEDRIGMAIDVAVVTSLLKALEFGVQVDGNSYLITVPSFRASKDIKIKEDILEEVARSFGFDNIALTLPPITRTPFSLQATNRISRIKHYFASGSGHLFEQQNYALADEQFLAQIGYVPLNPVKLLNPVSEHYSIMISSLIPGLLKNITENHVHRDRLAFFECGRIWSKPGEVIVEKRSVAGVYFKKRQEVDFYTCKQDINNLFADLGLAAASLSWHKKHEALAPWYHPYQTAQIEYAGKVIGVLGKINPAFVPRLAIDAECDAVLFELDGDFLRSEPPVAMKYITLSKFQDTFVDVSLLVPRQLPAAQVVAAIRSTSALISNVEQIDSFENKAWQDVRALTYRLWLTNHDRTLEKHEIDQLWKLVTESIKELGVQVRA